MPSLTLIVPFGRIPRMDSDVPVVTGTVPIAVAGEAKVLEPEEEAEDVLVEPVDVEPLEDAALLPDSSPCTSAEIWLLTRLRAVSLAMLASPLDSLTINCPMSEMSELLALS